MASLSLERPARITLAVLQAAVALTAAGGGIALIIGSVTATSSSPVTPPVDFLAGSPFAGYLVPGVLLLAVIGGLHALAFLLTVRRSAWSALSAAIAAFGLLIWIFVQMVWIPFSPLQAAYEGAAIIELALVLVRLGVLDVLVQPHRTSSSAPAGRQAEISAR